MSITKSPTIDEHLSAMLDDEAGSFEQRRVLDELKADQKLSQKLSSYALIGETMRTGDTEKAVLPLGSSFLDSIHEQIAAEDKFNEVLVDVEPNKNSVVPSQTNRFSWLRPAGGFAVAASVGALAFMGLQNAGLLSSPQEQPRGIVDTSAPTAIVQSVPTNTPSADVDASRVSQNAIDNDQYVDADAETRSMLKRYVDTHMQYTTTSTFVPSVRALAYADNQ